MTKKELLKTIRAKLATGKTKDEILQELQSQEPEVLVRKLLAITPTQDLIEKYKTQNQILLFFILVSVILKTGIGLLNLYVLDVPVAVYLVAILVLPLINLAFFFGIRKFNGSYYMLLSFFCAFGLFRMCQDLAQTMRYTPLTLDNYDLGTIILNFVMVATIVTMLGLSYWLSKKMFPYLNFWRFKVDKNLPVVYQ